MPKRIGDIDVEAGHLVADLGDLADRDCVWPRQLGRRRIATITIDGEAAKAGKGHLGVVDQKANQVIRRVGHERIPVKYGQAKGLLGNLGGGAHGRRAGVGRELGPNDNRGGRLDADGPGWANLGNYQAEEQSGRTHGAPTPDPPAAPCHHAVPPWSVTRVHHTLT